MNNSVFDEFEMLTETVLEGAASREEIARFNELIREFPDLFSVYVEQLQMHLTLQFRCGQGTDLESVRCDVRELSRPHAEGRNVWRRRLWKMTAAAGVALLAGAAMWYAADFSGTSERYETAVSAQADSVLPAVRLVSQKGVKGLDLPETLPGTLRLESGEVAVRLMTGVELILIGPVEVDAENGLQVFLARGKLLARVPHWATGFTVRTRELEIYDLGTVFSVQVNEGVSDVFVFKGSVQVNESGGSKWGRETSGAGVGICEAGEGVRAVSGACPEKIAADWPEAQALFGGVQAERAVHDPAKTMGTAMRIADLWAERYMPGANLAAKQMKIGNGIPFKKTAWVRTAAPEQETASMEKINSSAILAATAVMLGVGTGGAISAPIQVDAAPCQNKHWSTVFTNEVPLRWNWNAAATRAELDIAGMGGTFVTNFSSVTSGYLWRAFDGTVPSREDVYDLTLTFYNGGDSVVGVLTSRLAVVTAAFGETAVNADPSDAKWETVRTDAVIPYDTTWAAATADAVASRLVVAKTGGAIQTNALSDASGYFGWKLKNSGWGHGTFDLALTFPDAEGVWDATVTYVPGGTIILMK